MRLLRGLSQSCLSQSPNHPIRLLMNLLSLFTLLASIAVLSSCSSPVDPGYHKLEALAETSPQPDAIVGMWHRKGAHHSGTVAVRDSLLFNRNHTGIHSYYQKDFGIGYERQRAFTWSYAGQGRWYMASDHEFIGRGTCMTAGGKLLRAFSFDGQTPVSWIYERVAR